MSKLQLSLIVPCYNEASRFTDGSTKFVQFLNKQKYKWEIIFIDDGSIDDTKNIIGNFVKKNKNTQLISYSKNKGKGYAISRGVQRASGDIILFSDIDNSVPIDTVNQFITKINDGYDVVIGSRRVTGATFEKKQPILRETLGRCFTLLVRLTIDWKIKDSTCGFKAFKKSVGRIIFSKITIYDWAFDAEMLFIAKKNNFKIFQSPVKWKDEQGSKVSLFKDIPKSLMNLLKIRLNGFSGKYN